MSRYAGFILECGFAGFQQSTSSPGPSPCSKGLLLSIWPEKFIRISSCKQYEMSSFCLNNGFRLQKTNRAGNNLRKSHFTMCHVTKYSTIRGVFQQPWPGVSPTAILNEEKALGMRLFSNSKKKMLHKVYIGASNGAHKIVPNNKY